MMDHEPSWMRELRAKARERFEGMSWPTTSDEEWRRTDVSGIDALSYVPRPAAARAAAGAAVPRTAALKGTAGVLRFEAGRCVESAISPEYGSRGVRFVSLDGALEEFERPLGDILDEALDAADDRFGVWHYASWSHGALLVVPPGVEIAEPFVIDFTETGSGVLAAPHVVVSLGEGARAVVVQRIGGNGGAGERILCNAGLDVVMADAAALSWFEVQDLGSESLFFRNARMRGGRDSSLRHFDAAFGSRLVKTRVESGLAGRGAEAYLDGVYFCAKGQHMDLRTVQRHHSPQATSRAYYKGAVASGGRTIYQGLIEVDPGASGTDAYLTNRNLVLGEGARSDSIPTLKIGNNDVRCSHGSTTGRLSDEELFYLESRGLSRRDAREMLVVGYFEDLLARAPEMFREGALDRIRSRMAIAA